MEEAKTLDGQRAVAGPIDPAHDGEPPTPEPLTARSAPDVLVAPPASNASESLQWPPPDDELEGWEVISLASQVKSHRASTVRFDDGESRPELDPPLVSGTRTDGRADAVARRAEAAAPSTETTAERLKRLVAATAPAQITEDEPATDDRKAPAPGGPVPEALVPAAVPPAARAGVTGPGVAKWVVPLALALGAAAGFTGGWFARPALSGSRQTAALLVESVPAGATVAIDGTARGKTPLRLDLPPGDRRLVVQAAGAKREVVLRLSPGSDVVRSFEFAPSASKAPLAVGSLQIETRPPGARVVIAGEPRGTAPVTVNGLTPGTHDVVLSLADRTLTQRVEIQAGRESVLVVPMGGVAASESGWVAVKSPVPLRILEGGSVIGTTESRRIMLPAGRHDLELVNERLEVRVARSVAVQGGRELALEVPLPQGRLSLNAQPWAEVFAGSERLGETPIANASLPVGDYEVIFRHPQLGERRQAVTVRANTPARVAVTFTP